jgi:hypothetical protein
MSVVGGKAEVICSPRVFPSLTLTRLQRDDAPSHLTSTGPTLPRWQSHAREQTHARVYRYRDREMTGDDVELL